MKTFAFTHTGLIRKKNEDRHLIKKITDDFFLLAVADGMGGEVAGDYAAEIIMKKINSIQQKPLIIKRQLSQLVKEADLAICDEVKINSALEGMGSTVTCGLLCDGRFHWAHVGDSRLFVFCNEELTQIIEDQNMAQFLVDEGEITTEEARHHPSQNQLDQCVGCGDCRPDTGCLEVNSGNLLLLTTDGLHGEITPEAFSSILTAQMDIEAKATSLIQAALDAGGKDNMTVVIADI